MKIDLCIATYRRAMLADTLASLDAARKPAHVNLRVLVIDNDSFPSARDIVDTAKAALGLDIVYIHAPAANISLARNAGLDCVTADWVGFLDDDEIVDPEWLDNLVACALDTKADAVFGPSIPIYPDDAPDWIVQGGFHCQRVPMRGNRVETGHTCNALVRWQDTAWTEDRFDLSLGRTGGEDTSFFAGLLAKGAVFAEAHDAVVREQIFADRLSFRWLAKRRFRIGQTYGELVHSPLAKCRRGIAALSKALYCSLRAGLVPWSVQSRNWWMLRGIMHYGVCAGCLSAPKSELYGTSVRTSK